MKKLLVLIIPILIAGCETAYDRQIRAAEIDRFVEKINLAAQQKQADLVSSFKEAYPDNWEEKLFEYKLHQEILQKQQQALSQQRELMRQYHARQNWQNFWQVLNENYQRQLDRNAYGYQPIIISSNRNSTHWQEVNAHDEWIKRNQLK